MKKKKIEKKTKTEEEREDCLGLGRAQWGLKKDAG